MIKFCAIESPKASNVINDVVEAASQCVGGPGLVVYGPVLLVTVIKEPAWDVSDAVAGPLNAISKLLIRSPADRGSACVLVNTTVKLPAAVVTTALPAQASAQVPEKLKPNTPACAAPAPANMEPAATTPARTEKTLDLDMTTRIRVTGTDIPV
jgi:hypothetical protein